MIRRSLAADDTRAMHAFLLSLLRLTRQNDVAPMLPGIAELNYQNDHGVAFEGQAAAAAPADPTVPVSSNGPLDFEQAV